MTREAVKTPQLLPVKPDAIPELLRGLDHWVLWQARTKPNGRVTKIPVNPGTRQPTNALDPANWLTFPAALAAHKGGVGQGIGIVLDGKPVGHDKNGAPLFLVGVDLDGIDMDALEEPTKAILAALRGTYIERSPSGRGLRLFALSRVKPRSGQGAGGELYTEKRFLTVTGQDSRGSIKDCTDGVRAVERVLWPEQAKTHDNVVHFPEGLFEINRRLSGEEWAETPENIARIRDALRFISPEGPYELWRQCVWAVASLDWSCGQELVEEWSSQSATHWELDDGEGARRTISALFRQYRPDRGVTVGSLLHHAYEGGMTRPERPTGPLFRPAGETDKQSIGMRLLSRDELDAQPPLGWVVRDVLPEKGLAAIYGEPGSGKSFVVLDLAAKISSGITTWFGRPSKQRDVVYVALEGGHGIKKRLSAWDVVNGKRADKIKILLEGFSLLNGEQVAEFAAAVTGTCEPGSVVIIDTLAQATAGADENSAQDMGMVLKAAQAISAAISGLVILVHHSGKVASRGLRGHSALNGAMDAVIAVERDQQTDRRTWRVTKMKDADDGAAGMFTLDIVDLGPDEFGGRITSCAVREVSGATAAVVAVHPKPKGANQQAVFDALKGHVDARLGWTQSGLMEVAKAALADISSQHRATRARATVNGLIDLGLLSKDEGGTFQIISTPPDHPPPSPHRGGGAGRW